MRFRRDKTVATLGPASTNPEVLRAMVEAGLDVARLNFSHGTWPDHLARATAIREVSTALGRPVAILCDLCGPKMRLGKLADPAGIPLAPGQRVTLFPAEEGGTATEIPCAYKDLAKDVIAGSLILVDDGNLTFKVVEVAGDRVVADVRDGGLLKSRKGINLPGAKISAPSLTDKDREDLEFALSIRADFVALSFVREAEDLEELRRLVAKAGGHARLIAKIERPEAIENLESIVAAADGIMVARGDLGVELPPEEVPALQKRMVKLANHHGKPVIVATQMLESMISNARPTRAEASDVANAILDGADACMLSAESASGQFPVEAVLMMERIGVEAEKMQTNRAWPAKRHLSSDPALRVAEAVCHAAALAAHELGAKLILALTASGETARLVSKYRPMVPILALTPSETTVLRTRLFYGVEGRMLPRELQDADTDTILFEVGDIVKQSGLAKEGDLYIVVCGHPFGSADHASNMLKVSVVP